MRRTSIMMEFTDEVYDSLVEPMKKNKSFSKLVASLLEGYLADGYIRAYADDTLEDMRRAAVSSFSASIDSMSESLSNMGLFSDELESLSTSGKTKFQEKAKKQSEDLDANGSTVSSNPEIDKLNKRIDDMQASIDEKLSQLLSVLSNGSVNITSAVKTSKIEDSKITSDVKKNVETVNSYNTSIIEDSEDEEDDVSEDAQEANNFMLSMLEGNSFEY